MAEVAAAGGAGPDVNTTGNPTEMAMAYLQDEKTDGDIPDINLGDLDLTTDEFILDEVDIHIQANLEDDLVKEALKTGVDLRQYSKQVESELQRIEQASIKDYIKESQTSLCWHNQSTACDSIWRSTESSFCRLTICHHTPVYPYGGHAERLSQCDLSSISSEIQTLQQQSVSMNVRLKNRQAVRSTSAAGGRAGGARSHDLHHPGHPRDGAGLSGAAARAHNKINFAKELSFRETLACSDIQDIVDQPQTQDLEKQAVSKIREFILQKIYSFRKPMTNYQIPQNTLLKYRFFYQFLLANERTVAKEIRDEYVDTMSKIYYSYFKSYSGRLLKVQYEEVADKDDLMGSRRHRQERSVRGGGVVVQQVCEAGGGVVVQQVCEVGGGVVVVQQVCEGMRQMLIVLLLQGFFSKPSLKSRNTIFTLREETAGIPMRRCSAASTTLCWTTAAGSFLFLSDFFMVTGNSALDLFNSIMGKTLSMFLKSMSTYVSDCYDSIAVFLCIHIILRFRAITVKRTIPALDKYWEAVLELLWPRFELILEMNINSIRNTDPQKLGVLDTRPHYITRRYAEFSSAIVSINQTANSVGLCESCRVFGSPVEVENFVLKMAAEFPSRRDQLIFLINNYDMMLSVLMERAADDSKEVEGFQQLLLARTQEFIEEILSPPFGGMIAFVKEAEALMEKGQLDRLKNDEARITQLIRGFSSSWKQSVEAMSQDVMRSFTNFKNGTSIIQGALTQLIQYYHGFHKVLNQPSFRSLAVRSELINLHHLMVEVKKHKPNF
ncbi:hypothetical protein KUCAC02_011236 [Chaenocephalus aceratus]|uniref:Uncharacterized protein n=1 Tax=Chaenocephalus aceratus TaxID=36190 RepID=A0ACB9WV38_CHAAC|nr:hypothetical protein KUCAC02_011236 [Chaenocephalus aceratus]